MTTPQDLIATLAEMGDSAKAAEMAAYHKTYRVFLGVPAAALDELARGLRANLDLPTRCALAQDLWQGEVHEGCILAAKLLTQARIRPDDAPVWTMISDWAQGFDSWALADAASIAGAKRLQAAPARLDEVEGWTQSANMWTRRAALVMTLPWARLPHPKAEDLAVRDRVLIWAEGYVPDRDRFIQKAIGWWLRELSRRDPDRVVQFVEGPGAALTKGAKIEALRLISAQ
ncbi:DNA alkylation repair protein [Roseinatronobacter bogoriensis]|uniref:DNA alkylation repair protein n=1 Tax=Roseinatronobacter bogoriensis subsp. barguzinensis TaxID=441209 RepID=A0A2K8KFI1_9RHOB|nr:MULTISPECIES: DNA alkylation repair protein [Rhodobaca]ATX66723.1 DNA alkylation repair protein [Rhodobaca barguzinensis]MBB4206180.1 3-methyladenine DNA glycosylase AlkD [Rhodobaca bogoriensis DSM 18756]TDW40924.1 3-methyladenine DNA glycosylase AlkD [Rhodobaca barguzinensis]TDY74898.1 3-methyladenine DNA glycosylase AlkD [Rhodobaca bogoriensis DSM 18756]